MWDTALTKQHQVLIRARIQDQLRGVTRHGIVAHLPSRGRHSRDLISLQSSCAPPSVRAQASLSNAPSPVDPSIPTACSFPSNYVDHQAANGPRPAAVAASMPSYVASVAGQTSSARNVGLPSADCRARNPLCLAAQKMQHQPEQHHRGTPTGG